MVGGQWVGWGASSRRLSAVVQPGSGVRVVRVVRVLGIGYRVSGHTWDTVAGRLSIQAEQADQPGSGVSGLGFGFRLRNLRG